MPLPNFGYSSRLIENLQARFSSYEQRERYIEFYQFPEGLKTKFARLHPALDAGQRELVFESLRDYFVFCLRARKTMISMPSQIADEAWHEFILFTRDYNDFCRRAFGCYLHHTPAEAMQSKFSAQDSVKRVWRLACRKERIDPLKPDRLPRIFAIDGMLAISGGLIYSLDSMGDEVGLYNANYIRCANDGLGAGRAFHQSGSSCGGSGHGGAVFGVSGSDAGPIGGGADHGGSDCGSSDGGGGGDCGSSCGGSSCGGSSCGGGGCGGGGCGGG